jgi:hypothetical protein
MSRMFLTTYQAARCNREDSVSLRFPAGEREFSLLRNVQTGFGTHPASYSMGTGSSLPGDKSPGL